MDTGGPQVDQVAANGLARSASSAPSVPEGMARDLACRLVTAREKIVGRGGRMGAPPSGDAPRDVEHDLTSPAHGRDVRRWSRRMSEPPATARLQWVDVAKAGAILLVVVHHSVIFAREAGWVPDAVSAANTAAGAVRMPLFFLVSGIFAARALSRPWRDVLQRRVLLYAWLYVLWVLIRFVFFTLVPDVRDNAQDADFSAVLVSLVLPATGLWFLYALAVFSVLAKLALRIPAGWQLAAAAVLSVAASAEWLSIDSWVWRNMAAYLIFFLIGMHAAAPVRALADRSAETSSVLFAALSAAVFVGMSIAGANLPGAPLLRSGVAVTCAVVIASLLGRRKIGLPLAWLGARTLPVYVLHVLWVSGLVSAADAVGFSPSGWTGGGAVLALVVTALSLSLLSHRLARASLPFLFDVPARWKGVRT